MRILLISFVLAWGICASQSALSHTDASLSRRPFDTAVPLVDRTGPAPRAFFDMLGLKSAHSHVLTENDRDKLAFALAQLTPLQQRILTGHLRSISFVEGMPNNALTYQDARSNNALKLYDITIRAGVLNETVSQLVTNKENSCFDSSGSTMKVSIDAGQMNALVYILLHEATHVVDGVLNFTPDTGKVDPEALPLTAAIWQDRVHAKPAYRDPILDATCWHVAGKKIPIADAIGVYKAFEKTPFASLYGSNNWHDDVAELVAWHDMTAMLHQPYAIQIIKAGKVVFSYAPMKSTLVQRRFRYLDMFYAR